MDNRNRPFSLFKIAEQSAPPLLRNNRGATMLEFALVIGLILALILVIIDGSRYFLLQNTLTRAAERAVNVAKKDTRLTYDLRPGSSPTEETVAAYRAAQQEIIELALSLSVLVSAESASDGPQKHMPYRMPNPRFGFTPGAMPVTADAALILPGQVVEYKMHSAGDTEFWLPVPHPTCAAGNSCPELDLPGSYGWQQLMLNHPIIVEVRSTLPIFSLLGRSMEVVGRAAAWQERVPVSLLASPLPQPTPTPDPSPESPHPPLCTMIGEEEACRDQCQEEHQACVFLPENTAPNCFTCSQKKCSDWTDEKSWCEARECADYQECVFNPNGVGTDCGTCKNGYCQDWKGEKEYCEQLNCEAEGDHMTCSYSPFATAPNCGECQVKRCHEYTTQEESCEKLECGKENEFETCDFLLYNYAPNCAQCRTIRCDGHKTREEVCGELRCEDLETPSVCDYYPYNDAPQCGQCRTAKCSEWTSEQEACDALNCGALGWEYTCNFNPNGDAPGCASCEKAACTNVTTAEEACKNLNCEAQGPEWKCEFQGKATAPDCAKCVKRTCSEMMTKEEFCSDKNCAQDQDCNFSPNAYWPNCGDGQCYDLTCKAWTTKPVVCADACGENEVCEFLPNAKGGVCHQCRPKMCKEVIGKKQACQAIGCDESLNNCIYDPEATYLTGCTATCEPKTCSQLTKNQACAGTVCSAWETCEINPGGEHPHCSECVDLPCGQWTTREKVCAACLNDPMQTCEWVPDSYGQVCGGCRPVPLCEPQICPVGEIWIPHPECRCEGKN